LGTDSRKFDEFQSSDSLFGGQAEGTFANLVEHMLNGVAYCRMLYENGRPVDFVYLFTNQAFHVQTGLGSVKGKRVSEVIPGIQESDQTLIDTYGRVASGGAPERFEIHIEALSRKRYPLGVLLSPARLPNNAPVFNDEERWAWRR